MTDPGWNQQEEEDQSAAREGGMEGGGQNCGLFLFYFLSFSSSHTYISLVQLPHIVAGQLCIKRRVDQ